MSMVLLLALAIVSGAAITLQGQFMGLMDRALGTRESVFLTYGTGGLIATLLIFAARGGNLRAAAGVPWYAFTAGLLGLVIVSTIGYVVPRLGVARAFTLIVAAQFLLATLIDHFGWFGAALRPIDMTRALGLAVMLGGLWLVVR